MGRARKVGWDAVAAVALSLAVPVSGWCAQPTLTLYAGVFGNREYVQVWEGVSGALPVHDRVSLLARITGIHVIDGDRFREGNSGVAEGGVGFTVAPNTRLSILGGTYFGDIDDPIIDGDVSTAQLIGGWWFYLYVGGLYGFESNRWQNTIYLSTPITDPAKDLVLSGGVESLIYNEGQLRRDDDFVKNPDSHDVKVQVGPVLGLYKRSWDAGLRAGVGGGDYGVYGTLSVFKTFSF